MAKNREILTDEEVEAEIERLKKSEAVRLAQRERHVKYRRRRYLYNLRNDEKHGKQMMAEGITMDTFDMMDPYEEAMDYSELG